MKLFSRQLMTQEFCRFPKLWQLILLAFNVLVAVFVSWLTPMLSPAVRHFLSRVFKMSSITEIVLLNDYLSMYMLNYWLIFFAILPILMIPAEEGYLSLFLSKPLTRRQYLFSRLIPVLSSSALLNLIYILSCALSIQLINRPSDFLLPSYLAGSGICFSLGLLMAVLIQTLLFWLKDTYNAILAGFFCLLVPVLPSSLLMYRPDLFERVPSLSVFLVFPANLIWLNADLIKLAYWLIPVLISLSAGFIWLTAGLLDQRDLS